MHNPRLLFYGRLPRFRLSDLGKRQAEFLADYLSHDPIDLFYSSPLLRARQTAAILARGRPLRLASDLLEVRTGWMGALPEHLPERINLYEPPHSDEDETIEQIWLRVSSFIRRVVRRHPGQTVCCVSHGDPVVIAHAGYLGLPMKLESIRQRWYPQKCSVTRLTFESPDAKPGVEYRDVIAELAPELKAPH